MFLDNNHFLFLLLTIIISTLEPQLTYFTLDICLDYV